ncbi:hypothetical protein AB6A40_003209 [Gnathostoma spinigerum]|uniref:Protein wntless n=1 Tax=Gnathostoma spinigerum TaxID=75299 RepID=A0ABD6EJP8_9BILA
MSGTVVENLSTKKLLHLCCCLFILLIIFFLLGAFLSPQPSSSMEFILLKCIDREGGQNPNSWFYLRPPHCDIIHDLDHYTPKTNDMRDIVFVAQMPHQREGVTLEYSAWFQFLLGLLEVDIEYDSKFDLVENANLMLEVRLGYQVNTDKPGVWHEMISTNITRKLECIPPEPRNDGHLYSCQSIDLFELGSNPYPFYLINIRLPVDPVLCRHDPKGPNCAIGRIKDLRLIAIHQNGGFTAVWLWMKTFVTPFVIIAVCWYWRRIGALNRRPYLIEYSIFTLGLSLAILDFPMEWISLWTRTPLMLLLGDIRQGLFYSILLCFWLIFTGEHLIDDTSRNNLASYWRNLTSVIVASGSLLVYDMAERGMQLSNPFFSIWASEFGSALAYTAVYIAAFCAFLYFFFLTYKVIKVWLTIKSKRAGQLYKTNENRRLKVEAVLYRFKFLMFFTLICAAFTIASYIMKQYGETQMHNADSDDSLLMHSTSAFFTGTFGMWNIYVVLLLAMYAPSHKQYSNATLLNEETTDLMDGTNMEASSLTTFVKPATD